MMQVTKVWWDGEKLMAEPIDPTMIYQEPAVQQEPQTTSQERTEFEQFWVDELGESDELTYGNLGYAIRRVNAAWEAWKAGKISANQQTIMGRKVWIDWKTQALELRELVRLGGIKIAELESALAAQTAQREDWGPGPHEYHSLPAQRTWVGLTDIEIQEIWFTHLNRNSQARAIEAKLKEKNT
jgi:hypothetical protein